MNNISYTAAAVITDTKSIFAYLDESTYKHPVANKFVFEYDENKYKIHIKGGSPKPYTGISQWKRNNALGNESLTTFANFPALKYNKLISPVLFYRAQKIPFDNSPMSPVYNQFGFMSEIPDMELTVLGLNDMSLMRLYREAVKNKMSSLLIAGLIIEELEKSKISFKDVALENDYSVFNSIRLYYEKIIPVLSSNNTIEILRYDDTISDITGSVYYYLPETGERNYIGSFAQEFFGAHSRNLAISGEYNLPKFSTSRGFEVMESPYENEYMFINNTDRYMLINTGVSEILISPYGVKQITTNNPKVYLMPYLYINLDAINIGKTYEALYHKNGISNIGGYNIKSSNYYCNYEINSVDKGAKTTQIGPLLFKGNSTINILDKQSVGVTIPCIEADDKGEPVKVNKQLKTVSVEYSIRYVNSDIYYQEKGSNEYKKAIRNKGRYYTDDMKYILGDIAFDLFETDIKYEGVMLIERDFKQTENNFYEIKTRAINPRGIVQYSKSNYKEIPPYVCIESSGGYKTFDTLNYKSYQMYDIKKHNDTFIEAFDCESGEIKHYSFKIPNMPGLVSQEGMIVKGGGIIDTNMNINDTVFHKFRTYTDKDSGMGVYYVVNVDDTDYIVLFPTTKEMDTFIECEGFQPEVICGNPKKVGGYDIKTIGDTRPALFVSIGEYTCNGSKLRKITDYKLDTIYSPESIIGVSPKIPFQKLISDISAWWFYSIYSSSVTEYITEPIAHSYILDKNIATIEELGLVIDNDDNSIQEPFKVSVIKDKNIRGAIAKSGDKTIKLTLEKNKENNLVIAVLITQGDKVLYKAETDWIPFYIPDNNNPSFEQFSSAISRNAFEKGGILGFVYEAFINYLVSNGVFVNTLIDVDESDGMIDESKVSFKINKEAQGYEINAYISDKSVDVINPLAALYFVKYARAYPVYGKLNIYIQSSFTLPPVYQTDNSEIYEFIISNIKNKAAEILYGYDLFSPLNVAREFALFYDTDFLVLEDKTFTVPKNQRVMTEVYLGATNTFRATKKFNAQDNIYSYIKGVNLINKFDFNEKNYHIEYYKVINDIILKRDISIDTSEQADWFSSYYNNAKAQLIQDLREDTYDKRLSAQYIDVTFDTEEIYNQVREINIKLWNIPVSFRCANMPDEAEFKKMLMSEELYSDEITFDDVFNGLGSKVIFFDDADEVTISLENAYLESDYNASYDVRDIALRITNKEFLYNDDNIKSYKVNSNVSKKDAR